MKGWLLVLGLTLLVIAFVVSREHFSATATIKNPSGWDDAEYARIKAMVTPASTISNTNLRRVVGGFWGVWDAATSQITLAQVNEYLDHTTGLDTKRSEYRDLIKAYYIDQGQSVFQTARGYSAGDMTTSSPPSDTSASSTPTTIDRPSSSTPTLRQDIAATAGVPANQDASITPFITQVQKFYDTVYLPDKVTPTYTQFTGFVDGVDTSLLPAAIQNNFKAHLLAVLQRYFTPASSVSGMMGGSASSSAGDLGGALGGALGGGTGGTGGGAGAGEAGLDLGSGKNVQGPGSGGQGSVDNTTGGLGQPRNLPVLYGGMQSYSSALPTSTSLGTDPMSKFLPFSRAPGDQDLYPDPYRLGAHFSTSSYTDKEVPEPAPFLADFSKFLT
jgi:hypothetical protein